MGSQADWLARLLANFHLAKTMEKEKRGSAQNAASNIPHMITGYASYRRQASCIL